MLFFLRAGSVLLFLSELHFLNRRSVHLADLIQIVRTVDKLKTVRLHAHRYDCRLTARVQRDFPQTDFPAVQEILLLVSGKIERQPAGTPVVAVLFHASLNPAVKRERDVRVRVSIRHLDLQRKLQRHGFLLRSVQRYLDLVLLRLQDDIRGGSFRPQSPEQKTEHDQSCFPNQLLHPVFSPSPYSKVTDESRSGTFTNTVSLTSLWPSFVSALSTRYSSARTRSGSEASFTDSAGSNQ